MDIIQYVSPEGAPIEGFITHDDTEAMLMVSKSRFLEKENPFDVVKRRGNGAMSSIHGEVDGRRYFGVIISHYGCEAEDENGISFTAIWVDKPSDYTFAQEIITRVVAACSDMTESQVRTMSGMGQMPQLN